MKREVLKVGDIVRGLNSSDGKNIKYKQGRVLAVNDGKPPILVEFDADIKGHNGNSGRIQGKKGHCWWCYEKDLEKISDFTLESFQNTMLETLKEEKLPNNLKTLDYEIEYQDEILKVGCQKISKQDALKLADAINLMWGE